MASAREEILNKLKKAIHPEPEMPDFDAPVYHSIEKSLDQAFKAFYKGEIYEIWSSKSCHAS